MVSHLVGLVGHVLIRVQLLNAARRLTEKHLGIASEGRVGWNFKCHETHREMLGSVCLVDHRNRT